MTVLIGFRFLCLHVDMTALPTSWRGQVDVLARRKAMKTVASQLHGLIVTAGVTKLAAAAAHLSSSIHAHNDCDS